MLRRVAFSKWKKVTDSRTRVLSDRPQPGRTLTLALSQWERGQSRVRFQGERKQGGALSRRESGQGRTARIRTGFTGGRGGS